MVTFDAGNTLFQLVEPASVTYARIARRHGYELDCGRLSRSFRAAWKANEKPPDSLGPRPDDGRDWWRRLVELTLSFAGYEIRDFSSYFEDVYGEFAKPGVWTLSAGVLPTLQRLKSGRLRLGIISNFDRRLYAILDVLEIASYFEHVLVSSEVGADKPSPRIFLEAVRRFRVSADHFLHVGDDQEEDGHGAANAGMQSLIIDHRVAGISAAVEAVEIAGAAGADG